MYKHVPVLTVLLDTFVHLAELYLSCHSLSEGGTERQALSSRVHR